MPLGAYVLWESVLGVGHERPVSPSPPESGAGPIVEPQSVVSFHVADLVHHRVRQNGY